MLAHKHRSPAENHSRVQLLGVDHDCLSLAELLDRVDARAPTDRPLHVVTSNMHFLTLARMQPSFARVVNRADVVTLDGRPLLWAARALTRGGSGQITGHDLFRRCAELASAKRRGIFLLGAAPGVAQRAAARLQQTYPRLRAMGTHHGTFDNAGRTDREEQLIARIRDFGPHYLFVALGAPKQEYWIARNLYRLGVPLCVGVGCVFDVYAGHLPRAPRWMSCAGLESLHQLAHAPGRWWKRYLLEDPPTALRLALNVARQKFGATRPSPRGEPLSVRLPEQNVPPSGRVIY